MHDRKCERLMLAGGRQGTGGMCSPLRTVWCGLPLTPHGYPNLRSPLRHPCGSAGLLEFLSLLFLSSSPLTLPCCALQQLAAQFLTGTTQEQSRSRGPGLHTIHFVAGMTQHWRVVPELHECVCLPLHLRWHCRDQELKG